MQQTNWQITDWLTFLATLATAVATFFLWRVTKVLAVQTKRMAEASAQPHVVASIQPNRWSLNHADLSVENTGNATAYDIQVEFNPPLVRKTNGRDDRPIPFQRLSLLKPGQGLVSWISDYAPLLDKKYEVTVSWCLSAGNSTRQSHTYTLDMADIKGVTILGSSEPLVQIADQLKKLREDWQWIARGSKRVAVDAFSDSDRTREQEEQERWYQEVEREEAATRNAAKQKHKASDTGLEKKPSSESRAASRSKKT